MITITDLIERYLGLLEEAEAAFRDIERHPEGATLLRLLQRGRP